MMKKNKLIFSHFLKSDGTKTDKARINAYQLGSEEFDDIELELTISDGKVTVDIFNKEDFDPDETKWMLKEFKHIDWEGGYEWITYFDIIDDSEMRLVANRPSEMSGIINSQQNISNLNDIHNVLKNKI